MLFAILKKRTSSIRDSESSLRLRPSRALSSAIVALRWVMASSSLTAVVISLMPVDCSCTLAAMSFTVAAAERAASTIWSSASPADFASRTPSATFSPLASVRCLMSLAASDERWARSRTSEATTANPLPASPARAASTAAFSASRLVWNEIASITLVISLIFDALASISRITPIVSDISALPRSARWAASAVSLRAAPAFSELDFTVAAISSMVAAVSSSDAAWDSACRAVSDAVCEMFWLPVRISPALLVMPPMTSVSRAARVLALVFNSAKAPSKSPAMRAERSPVASAARTLPVSPRPLRT